jgi:hypothetical protein
MAARRIGIKVTWQEGLLMTIMTGDRRSRKPTKLS